MHKAGQRALSLFNEHLSDFGIDVRQFSVLCVLDDGPCSQTDLCDVLRIDRTTMVQLIDALESNKLLGRTVNQEDRRAHVVLITEEGRRTLKRAHARAIKADEEFLRELTTAESKQLLSLLSKIM